MFVELDEIVDLKHTRVGMAGRSGSIFLRLTRAANGDRIYRFAVSFKNFVSAVTVRLDDLNMYVTVGGDIVVNNSVNIGMGGADSFVAGINLACWAMTRRCAVLHGFTFAVSDKRVYLNIDGKDAGTFGQSCTFGLSVLAQSLRMGYGKMEFDSNAWLMVGEEDGLDDFARRFCCGQRGDRMLVSWKHMYQGTKLIENVASYLQTYPAYVAIPVVEVKEAKEVLQGGDFAFEPVENKHTAERAAMLAVERKAMAGQTVVMERARATCILIEEMPDPELLEAKAELTLPVLRDGTGAAKQAALAESANKAFEGRIWMAVEVGAGLGNRLKHYAAAASVGIDSVPESPQIRAMEHVHWFEETMTEENCSDIIGRCVAIAADAGAAAILWDIDAAGEGGSYASRNISWQIRKWLMARSGLFSHLDFLIRVKVRSMDPQLFANDFVGEFPVGGNPMTRECFLSSGRLSGQLHEAAGTFSWRAQQLHQDAKAEVISGVGAVGAVGLCFYEGERIVHDQATFDNLLKHKRIFTSAYRSRSPVAGLNLGRLAKDSTGLDLRPRITRYPDWAEAGLLTERVRAQMITCHRRLMSYAKEKGEPSAELKLLGRNLRREPWVANALADLDGLKKLPGEEPDPLGEQVYEALLKIPGMVNMAYQLILADPDTCTLYARVLHAMVKKGRALHAWQIDVQLVFLSGLGNMKAVLFHLGTMYADLLAPACSMVGMPKRQFRTPTKLWDLLDYEPISTYVDSVVVQGASCAVQSKLVRVARGFAGNDEAG